MKVILDYHGFYKEIRVNKKIFLKNREPQYINIPIIGGKALVFRYFEWKNSKIIIYKFDSGG